MIKHQSSKESDLQTTAGALGVEYRGMVDEHVLDLALDDFEMKPVADWLCKLIPQVFSLAL
jgi:hypothetical protein